MERIFVANIKYGKVAINPSGIKRMLVKNAKNKEAKRDAKVKTK